MVTCRHFGGVSFIQNKSIHIGVVALVRHQVVGGISYKVQVRFRPEVGEHRRITFCAASEIIKLFIT